MNTEAESEQHPWLLPDELLLEMLDKGYDPRPLSASAIIRAITQMASKKRDVRIGIGRHAPTTQSNQLAQIYKQLSNIHLRSARSLARKNNLPAEEMRALVAIGVTASFFSHSVLTQEPLNSQPKRDDICAVLNAWLISCAIELFWILIRSNNKATNLIGTTPIDFLADFAQCIPLTDADKIIDGYFGIFNDQLEISDTQSLMVFQPYLFSLALIQDPKEHTNLLADQSNHYQVSNYAFVSQEIRIHCAKLFDDTVALRALES